MNTKQRNIVKWYKAYVANHDKSIDDIAVDIPYAFVRFKTPIVYSFRKSWSSKDKFAAIHSWLKANVNRDRFVYCVEVDRNSVMTAMYDNGLWNFGRIAGIAFQSETDAIMFKLTLADHIHS